MPLTDLVHYLNDRNRSQYGTHLSPGDSLNLAHNRVTGRFAGLTLDSAFQPITDARSGQVSGHEALLRATAADGSPLAPEAVFVLPTDGEEIVFLDRLARTVHALNYLLQTKSSGGDLYLNIHPRHLLAISGDHGLVFEAILKRLGLTPERVVLEILESAIDDSGRIKEAVANYRSRGYRIAIDDFGRHHSNFDRLWQLEPDVVKLDRSLIVEAGTNPKARRVLPRLVEIVHDLEARVVFEGIETADQLAIAIDAGSDQLQGYYLARPARECLPARHALLDTGIATPFPAAAGSPPAAPGPHAGFDPLPEHQRQAA